MVCLGLSCRHAALRERGADHTAQAMVAPSAMPMAIPFQMDPAPSRRTTFTFPGSRPMAESALAAVPQLPHQFLDVGAHPRYGSVNTGTSSLSAMR